jgi:hypothetical protein
MTRLGAKSLRASRVEGEASGGRRHLKVPLGVQRWRQCPREGDWRPVRETPTQNFFKHADKEPDPTAAIEFDPRETHYILFECFEAYPLLTGRSLRELSMFLFWFPLENPDLLMPSPEKDAVLAVMGDGSAPHRDRAAYMVLFNRYVGPTPHLN